MRGSAECGVRSCVAASPRVLMNEPGAVKAARRICG